MGAALVGRFVRDAFNRLVRTGPAGMSPAFTLLEVIIVIGIVAFAYSVALPNLNLITGNEVATRIGQLREDIRAAWDYSLVTRKPLRMVFDLYRGRYWLEAADEQEARLGGALAGKDLSPEEERYRQEAFEEEFQKYADFLGEPVKYTDPKNGREKEVIEKSPVLLAKEQLKGPSWSRLDTHEWGVRELGDFLVIQDLWAEHHDRPVSLEEFGQEALAMIYLMPSGYVEKSVIHIGYKLSEGVVDPERAPYTIVTRPYEGFADVSSGYEEVDIRGLEK